MLAEKIIFAVIALYLLMIMFFKLIKSGDKIYIPVVLMRIIWHSTRYYSDNIWF